VSVDARSGYLKKHVPLLQLQSFQKELPSDENLQFLFRFQRACVELSFESNQRALWLREKPIFNSIKTRYMGRYNF
jgi:hypothetical protein